MAKELGKDAERIGIEFVVPLLPYERTLLSKVAINFFPRDTIAVSHGLDHVNMKSMMKAFKRWRWGHKVEEMLREELNHQTIIEEWGGDRVVAYDRCFHLLADSGSIGTVTYRANLAREMNRLFLNQLGNRDSGCVQCVWSNDDLEYWRILDKIHLAHGQPWRRPNSLDGRSDHFEIWELVRIYCLHSQYPDSGRWISSEFTSSDTFLDTFTVSPASKVEEDVFSSLLSSGSIEEEEDLFEPLIIERKTSRTSPEPAGVVETDSSSSYSEVSVRSFLHFGVHAAPLFPLQ